MFIIEHDLKLIPLYICGFRCLLSTMQQHPHRGQFITMACCVLQNLLQTWYPTLAASLLDREDPVSHQLITGAWREDDALVGLELIGRNTSAKVAKVQRNYLSAITTQTLGNRPAGYYYLTSNVLVLLLLCIRPPPVDPQMWKLKKNKHIGFSCGLVDKIQQQNSSCNLQPN